MLWAKQDDGTLPFFNSKTTLLHDYQIATTLLAKYKSCDFSSNTEISSIAQ